MSEKLTAQYNTISDYMAANQLVINADKTHLIVMGTKKTASRRNEVSLLAGDHNIVHSRTEKLLGAHICEDLKWKEHLLNNEQSAIRQLTSRVNGLVKICERASPGTRLKVANGIFISKLCYLIELWGGCEEYLLNSLQILQNRAARTVTRKFWYTSTRVLLTDCGWLSVRQLIVYHSVLSAHKTVTSRNPLYMHNAMSTAHPLRTRQATGGQIRLGQNFDSKQGLIHDSFRYRAAKDYNSIPAAIRSIRYLPSFKKKLKQWVRSNIPID